MKFPFTASPTNISLFFNGRMHGIPASHKYFGELYEHLKGKEHDAAVIERIVDIPKLVARMTHGHLSVVGSTVYHAGVAVHTTLTLKLVAMLDAGFDVTPWVNFFERVMANPSERSRSCLYDFLEHHNAPLTEDGHFLAFKRVRNTYKDIHSGKFDNTPGRIVAMDRSKVDDNPDQTCSSGLHVAASSYLNEYASAAGNKTIVCKVDPADVVAVPADYKFAKMRVCRYEVLGDAVETTYDELNAMQVAPKATEDKLTDTYTEQFFVQPDVGGGDPYTAEEIAEMVDGYDHDSDYVAVRTSTLPDTDDTDDLDDEDNTDDLDDEDDLDGEDSELAFNRGGITYTASALRASIKQHGQRGFSRATGIPRTTLQDWLLKIEACE